MRADERRERIRELLAAEETPLSASRLASLLHVSRQIVVGDIALLRASGTDIDATPRGYLLQREAAPKKTWKLASCHDEAGMERELQICVDNGCRVLDVIVEHPIYGQLTGELQISSRYDIEQFIEHVRQNQAHALSELTNGIHLHTLECPNEEAYRRVCRELEKEGILLRDQFSGDGEEK